VNKPPSPGFTLSDIQQFDDMRNGSSNPFGKCTESLTTLVPPGVKEKFTALAVMKSGGVSEYLREIVMREILGEFELTRLQSQPRRGRAGMSDE